MAGSAFVLVGLVALMVFKNLQTHRTETLIEKPELPAVIKSGDPFENAKFSEIPFRIYQVDSISPKNILVSERVLNQAVTLLLNMTSSSTEKELLTLFGLSLENQTFPESLKIEELGFNIQNTIKVKSKSDLKRSLLDRLEKNHLANIESLKPEEAKSLNLGAGARIYVQQSLTAYWKNASVKEVQVLFRSSAYSTRTVTNLAGVVEAQFFEDTNGEWIEIPLTAEPWVVGFGKNKDGTKLSEIENQLSLNYINQIVKNLSTTKKLEVSIPKLHLNQIHSIKNWFNLAGYHRFFDLEANYSKVNSGKNGKWLDDLVQESTISISAKLNNEETRASGDNFSLNGPFLFYVRNAQTQEVLILGRYYAP